MVSGLEQYVRAVGAALARGVESYGIPTSITGVPNKSVDNPTAPGDSGRTAAARVTNNAALQQQLARIAASDSKVAAALREAATGSAAGRAKLIAALRAANGDVTAIGPHTRTPPGRKALIDALSGRVGDGKTTITGSDGNNRTLAGRVTNTGYPTGSNSTPTMPSIPQMPQIQTPQVNSGQGSGFSAAPIRQLLSGDKGSVTKSSKRTTSASRTADSGQSRASDDKGDRRKKIPLSSVDFTRTKYPGGKAAYRGYILSALDHAGIKDPKARMNWLRGMEVVAQRESTKNNLAVNLVDVNAHGARQSDGHPKYATRGPFQFRPDTFAESHMPGTSRNIYNPVASAGAFINRALHVYNVDRDGSNLAERIQQANPRRAPKGY
ncbi:hypothetical protein GCM10009551_053580 [Nocardiopsis tropica]|uniref:hypothetical protein n=1 Tax=Tsukamurella strandjordii TaxID=147577 RepID=UPI0031D52F7B